MFASCTPGCWIWGRWKGGGSRQTVPSLEPFVSLLQIWSECPQTSHHPTTNTLIPDMELEVLQQRGNRKLWSEWKDATHSWVPRASTKALRCTEGAPTSAFPQATPLWSSRGQIVFPKPQQHWNQSTTAVHSPSIESCTWYSWTCKAWNKQAGSSSFCWPKRWSWQKCFEWDHEVSQNFVRGLFWGCTTYNVRFWNIDRTSSWIECLCFCSLIAGNSATARVSASKCTNPWYISEGTEASFLHAFSKFVDNRRWERRLTKMPGIRNRKLKTCLQRLGIRLSNSSRASFFNAKSFSTGKRFGPWRAQDPECCDSRRVYNQCNAALDVPRLRLGDQVS